MLITVQGTTPKYSSIEVQHCTALMARSFACIQPSTTAPSFAIFISAACGHARRWTRTLESRPVSPAPAASSSFIFSMRPKISDRSIGSTAMPLRLQHLLAVADRVERRRPRADRAHAQACAVRSPRGRPPRTTPDPVAKLRRSGSLRVQRGERIRESGTAVRLLQALILPQKLSRRSAISHLARRVRSRLDQHRERSTPPAAASRRRVVSSPKFGSVTMMPSILPRSAANIAAHLFASSRVSTAPYLVCSGVGQITRCPASPAPRSSALCRISPGGPEKSLDCQQ